MNSKIIAVDFDGTIVAHEYPKIGQELPGAFKTLSKLQANGHKLILWTMRHGETLQEAVDYVQDHGITLWGINQNPDQHTWSQSTKQYAHLYIDDAALGCPTKFDPRTQRPVVNWRDVAALLERLNLI